MFLLHVAENLYGLSNISKLLVTTNECCASQLVLMHNHPDFLAPWHNLNRAVQTGEHAYRLTHGKDIWDHIQDLPENQKLFTEAMIGESRLIFTFVLEKYDGFKDVKGVITDVGGGLGTSSSLILSKYPHLRGINFDLPYVVSSAPEIPGVGHVGGDIFEGVPPSDAIFMKWILHDWNDEDGIHILKNCHKALAEDGRVILVESIVKPDSKRIADKLAVMVDLAMMAHSVGGSEREESEWRYVFTAAGFSKVKIVETGHFQQVIELLK